MRLIKLQPSGQSVDVSVGVHQGRTLITQAERARFYVTVPTYRWQDLQWIDGVAMVDDCETMVLSECLLHSEQSLQTLMAYPAGSRHRL